MASTPEIYQAPIERLGLSPRSLNSLKRAHITRVGEVLEMTDAELVKIRNFGEKCLGELYRTLAGKGIARHPGEAPEPGDKEEPRDKGEDF